MIVKHLSIRNFRGIKELDWFIEQPVVCLIGAGDSTKTTILDAIELGVYSSWSYQFDDTDFYNCSIENPIQILVTIGNLPEELMSIDKFGLYCRAFRENEIIDEPPEDYEGDLLLTIKLEVNSDLEPKWTVFNDRNTDVKEISHKQRAKFGANRLGTYIDRHLTWSKTSALNRLTENIKDANSILIDATRELKNNVDFSTNQGINETIVEVTNAAEVFGIKPKNQYSSSLDVKSISMNYGAISLHDENIPVKNYGYGSKRLLTLGLQLKTTKNGGIILIDEVENGLEPFRLRNMLRKIKSINTNGQFIMTSHSPTVLVELGATPLTVVKNVAGITTCINVPEIVQGTVRKIPEALLGRKIIVCEGATEYGLIIEIEEYWQNKDLENFAYLGVVPIDGRGSTFEQLTIDLKRLGYNVCALLDADIKKFAEKKKKLTDSGISVFDWEDPVSIEESICNSITIESLDEYVKIAATLNGKEYSDLLTSIKAKLSNSGLDCNILHLKNWIESGISDEDLKTTVGQVSKKKEWFKSIGKGQELGKFYIKHLANESEEIKMNSAINSLKNWVYAD